MKPSRRRGAEIASSKTGEDIGTGKAGCPLYYLMFKERVPKIPTPMRNAWYVLPFVYHLGIHKFPMVELNERTASWKLSPVHVLLPVSICLSLVSLRMKGKGS